MQRAVSGVKVLMRTLLLHNVMLSTLACGANGLIGEGQRKVVTLIVVLLK